MNEIFGHYHFLHVPTSKVEPIWMLNSSIEPLFSGRHIRARLYGFSTHLDIATLQLLSKNFRNNFTIIIIIINFLIIYKEKKKHKQDEAESLS